MDDMTEALEMLMLCASLSEHERDCVERALDEGYEALPDRQRALLRRLVNAQAAKRSMTPLQRYRLRKQQAAEQAARLRSAPLKTDSGEAGKSSRH